MNEKEKRDFLKRMGYNYGPPSQPEPSPKDPPKEPKKKGGRPRSCNKQELMTLARIFQVSKHA